MVMNTLLSVFHLILGIVISGVAHTPDSGDPQAITSYWPRQRQKGNPVRQWEITDSSLHIPSQMKSLNDCPLPNPHTYPPVFWLIYVSAHLLIQV